MVNEVHKISLRSQIQPSLTESLEEDQLMLDFSQKGTYCAIPAPEKSSETVKFVKIVEHHINNAEFESVTDDWGQQIGPGHTYIEGRYCLPKKAKRNGTIYKIDSRKVYLFKECIVYPFVQFEVLGADLFLATTELCIVVNAVENSGMATI